MKKAITLIEIIFSLVILSVILITSSNVILQLNQQNNTKKQNLLLKIDFETTRLFLQNKIKEKENIINNLNYTDMILYYNNNILLKKVSNFTISKNQNIIFLNLCINYNIEVCQDIRIKDEI